MFKKAALILLLAGTVSIAVSKVYKQDVWRNAVWVLNNEGNLVWDGICFGSGGSCVDVSP